jgi:hypothetical protein
MNDKERVSASGNPRRSLFSRTYLYTEVDSAATTLPMIAYCFMTGWMYVSLSFLQISWEN